MQRSGESVKNPGEAAIVASVLKALFDNHPAVDFASGIGVITPYR